MIEVAQATVTIIPNMQGAQATITEELTGTASAAGTEAGKAAGSNMVSSMSGAMSKAGGTLTKGLTAPIAAVGAASVAAWKEVDAGLDTIVTKTGASGDALESMRGILTNVASDIPTDFKTAGEAIGEVNTRFGLTGDALEELSTQFIKFSEINGTDVSSSIDAVQSSMAAFGLSAEDASLVLDTLNKAGQDTGVDLNTLSTQLTTNASAMKELGYSYSDSAMFLANLSKNGLDTSTVISGLSRAQANAAKNGVSLSDSLAEIEAKLQDEATASEAATEVLELFGTRAGPKMVEALQSGKLSFDELNTSMTDFSGSVSDTFEATLDPMDGFKTTMNELKAIGADLIDSVGPALSSALSSAADVVKQLAEAWNGLSPEMQETIVKIALIAAAIGPVISIGGTLISTIGALGSGISGVVGSIGGFASSLGGIGSAASAAAGPVAAAGASFGTMAGEALKLIAVGASLMLVGVGIKLIADSAIAIAQAGAPAAIAMGALAAGILVLIGVMAALGATLTAGAIGIGVFGAAVLGIGVGIGAATAGISLLVDSISRLVATISANAPGITAIIDQIGQSFANIIATIYNGISGVLNSVAGIFDSIGNAAVNAGKGLSLMADGVVKIVGTNLADMVISMGTLATAMGKISKDSANISATANALNLLATAIKSLGSGAVATFTVSLTTSLTAITSWSASTDKAFREAFANIAGVAESALKEWNKVIASELEAAKDTVAEGLADLQELFEETEFKFGNIKLPHFSMSGSFNAEKGEVPEVTVKWYAQAAKSGAIFTSPALIGVGDAAEPEMLIGKNTLFEMISEAVKGGGYNQTINITTPEHLSPSETARLVRNNTVEMMNRVRGGV